MDNVQQQIEQRRQKAKEAADYILSKSKVKPRVGIVLGSGLGDVANHVEDPVVIPYADIPHFPVSTVSSHAGQLMVGTLSGQPVFLMQGRFHYYEGYTMQEVTFPQRVMKAVGCEVMIVTNAVGCMNKLMPKGSQVFIDDHINFTGDNPLIGPNDDELGDRFPDMSEPYNQKLIALGEDVARRANIPAFRGVLVGVAGPNLETRAEYRAFRMLGGDIVGMSTVPETLEAHHARMKVLGISTVTDECFPDCLGIATHEEVVKTATEASPKLDKIIQGVLERLDEAL